MHTKTTPLTSVLKRFKVKVSSIKLANTDCQPQYDSKTWSITAVHKSGNHIIFEIHPFDETSYLTYTSFDNINGQCQH